MASIAPIVASYFKLFKNLDKVTKELKLSYFTIKTTYKFRVIYYLDCMKFLKGGSVGYIMGASNAQTCYQIRNFYYSIIGKISVIIRTLFCFLCFINFNIADAQITMAKKADWISIG